MLAPLLLCAYLLLAAPASRAWPGVDPEEPGSSTAAQIRDMHEKVTAIWQELMQRQAAADGPDAALHAACRVEPSAT
ncbi:unnamed protein product, partial [Gulo gulo]